VTARTEHGLSATKEALLARWRAGGTTPPSQDATIPRRLGAAGPAPLSFAQQRLWILEQLQPGTPAYNLFFCGRLGGHLDPVALATAVGALVDRHETLRTVIGSDAGQPVQRTGGAAPALEVVTLPDSGDPDAAVAAAMDDPIHTPFALGTGPLARVILLRGNGSDALGLVVHHIVADGWSLGVALTELSELYLAAVQGRDPDLTALPIAYPDFASWQRANVRAIDWGPDLAYWRERLRDLTPLELPCDRPRPAVISTGGDSCELRLTAGLSRDIRRLAGERDATPFMVLLAAYVALLRALSGQDDLTVGTAIAHRLHPETFGLIGDFINMLALRTDAGGDPAFVELLDRVRRTCTEAFAHQQAPFERVVQELNPIRDTSRSTVFQALLVLQPATAPADFAGLPLELVELGSRTVRADVELHLWDRPEFVGRLAYSTDLFDRATAERLAARLVGLLEQVAVDPHRRLSGYEVVLSPERAGLARWRRGSALPADVPPVHEQIARQAARTPDASAVLAHGERLTFADLDRAANRLAHHLRALGVGPQSRVGVCVSRSAAMVTALLGVLKAGGAYVPLDPGYPGERLAFMLADAGATIVITDGTLADSLVDGVGLVRLDTDRDEIEARPDTPPAGSVSPLDLAYVIYTSGSTGRPKGVQVEHRALASLALALRQRPGLRAGDVMTCLASLSFDASVAEIFPPLAAGAAVVVVTAEEARDGARLAAVIAEHRVTVVQAVATTWRLLLGAGGVDGARVRALCGGEPTPPDLARALAERHREAWNLYGPTECCVWASAGQFTAGGPVSLGAPLAGQRLYVLDEHLSEVPFGVLGELCVGGGNVARGYLGAPAATAERFAPDPFGGPGQRLYRTGDLARRHPDGTLEFVGRRDHQIKLRGYRIELGEVEAVLTGHSDVDQAAVVVHETRPGLSRLVAYVTSSSRTSSGRTSSGGTSSGGSTTVDGVGLASYLRQRLPEHMVPSVFVALDELPITPSGKLDRGSLPDPDLEAGDAASFLAPRNAVEREVAAYAADILGLSRMGVRDDFFERGGQSLAAAQLVTALRVRYGVELAVQDLFVDPTIEHLAGLVEAELARERHLGDEDGRIRRIVADMPEDTVDALVAQLLATAG
jgi:amino acid adenylation domain-containing protein